MNRASLPSPSTTLRSSAGAFDLPSIITGVVVIGILAAGVLAAIFGVIPFVQNNAAKQDLAAINTGEGVAYAKDGQKYKDLSGLESSGLVSGLDPAKAAVLVGKEGKAFTASVLSGAGISWCISNEDTEPRECGAATGEEAVAMGFCTPNVLEAVQLEVSAFQHPGFPDYFKAMNGLEDFDMDAAMSFMEWQGTGEPLDLGEEEYETLGDLMEVLSPKMYELFMAPPYNGQFELLTTETFAGVPALADETIKEFCSSYGGPVPWISDPTFAGDWNEVSRLHALTGSTDPIVMEYNTAFGSDDDLTFTLKGTEGIPGFKTATTTSTMVDGRPHWRTTLTPKASGWGESPEEFKLDVTVDRKNATGKTTPESWTWSLKANPVTVKIVQDSYQPPSDTTAGLGGSWDHHINHIGSAEADPAKYFRYALEFDGTVPERGYNYLRKTVTLENTGGEFYGAGTSNFDDGSGGVTLGWYNNGEETTTPGTIKVRHTVTDKVTNASDSHVFEYTLVEPGLGKHPKLVVDQQYGGLAAVRVEDGYQPTDYAFEVVFDGETYEERSDHSVYVEPEFGGGNSGRLSATMYTGAKNQPELRVANGMAGFDTAPEDPRWNEMEVKVTYRPTGESSTVKVQLTW